MGSHLICRRLEERNVSKFLTVLLLVFGLGVCIHTSMDRLILVNSQAWNTIGKRATANEIKGEDLPKVKPFACVRNGRYSVRRLEFIMCIKNLNVDKYISKKIFDEGSWERSDVELILKLLSLYPQATLLDIGSNIGSFSLAAAAANYKVVAVDPFPINLGFQRLSSVLQGSQDKLSFIANSVSDDRCTMYPWNRMPDNEGAISFINEVEAASVPSNEVGDKVESVLLQDLLDAIYTETVIIKIDVEGHECKALLPFLQTKIKSKYVPYILMEWNGISENWYNHCPDITPLLQEFHDSKYYPADFNTMREISIKNESSWLNVLWIHKDAKLQTSLNSED